MIYEANDERDVVLFHDSALFTLSVAVPRVHVLSCLMRVSLVNLHIIYTIYILFI